MTGSDANPGAAFWGGGGGKFLDGFPGEINGKP